MKAFQQEQSVTSKPTPVRQLSVGQCVRWFDPCKTYETDIKHMFVEENAKRETSHFSKDTVQKEVKEYAFYTKKKTQITINRLIDGQILN